MFRNALLLFHSNLFITIIIINTQAAYFQMLFMLRKVSVVWGCMSTFGLILQVGIN